MKYPFVFFLLITSSVQAFTLVQTNSPKFPVDEVSIEFSLLTDQHGSLEIVDEAGRVIKNLLKGSLTKGLHKQVFLIQNLPNGAYLIRLTTNNSTLVQKLLVVH